MQVEESDEEVGILTFAPCPMIVDRESARDEPIYAEFDLEGPQWYGTT